MHMRISMQYCGKCFVRELVAFLLAPSDRIFFTRAWRFAPYTAKKLANDRMDRVLRTFTFFAAPSEHNMLSKSAGNEAQYPATTSAVPPVHSRNQLVASKPKLIITNPLVQERLVQADHLGPAVNRRSWPLYSAL